MTDQKPCTGLVVVYRVSTSAQGELGLGMRAQQNMVEQYQKQVDLPIKKSFTEVESGKRSRRKIDLSAPIWQLIEHRPVLRDAIRLCQKNNYRLVIAKLDRLARDVAFTACLQGSGVDFVACDNPAASPLTIGILAVIAQEEARLISERTKSALKAFKDNNMVPKHIRMAYPNGVPQEIIDATAGRLGSARIGHWKNREHLRLAALERARAARIANLAKRESAYADILPEIKKMESEGKSLLDISKALNEKGCTTSRGSQFKPYSVGRVLGRY